MQVIECRTFLSQASLPDEPDPPCELVAPRIEYRVMIVSSPEPMLTIASEIYRYARMKKCRLLIYSYREGDREVNDVHVIDATAQNGNTIIDRDNVLEEGSIRGIKYRIYRAYRYKCTKCPLAVTPDAVMPCNVYHTEASIDGYHSLHELPLLKKKTTDKKLRKWLEALEKIPPYAREKYVVVTKCIYVGRKRRR